MDYNIDEIIEKAKSGDKNSLLKNIPSADSEKIKKLLNDKEACEKLLNSEKAKKILEMLKRGGIIGG